MLTTVRYPLGRGVSPKQVRAALTAIECLRPASENFWNWIRAEAAGLLTDKNHGKKTGRKIITTMEDGTIVLGIEGPSVDFRGEFSRARQGRGEILEAVLGKHVGEPTIEQLTPAELMAARSEKKQAPPPDLSPTETRALIHLTLDRLSSAVGRTYTHVGGYLTPHSYREQERAGKGLPHMARVPSDDPMAGYEFGWLWEELGIADHRR